MSKEDFDKIKKLFSEIKESREVSIQLFNSLDIKIKKLQEIHNKLIKDNKDINFIVGLDSFNFQKILLRKEYDNLDILYKMIMNRIYFDYYKLSKIIKTYVNENIEDINIKDAVRSYSQYPIYDTLKIYREYDFDVLTMLYQDLVNTLIVIEDFCSNEENRLEYYENQQEAGLNINSFVLSFKSNLAAIRNKNKLFTDCMNFFVTLHNSYFKKFLTSLRILHSRVKHDIRFDESTLNSKKSTSLILNELTQEIDNKSFIDEITRQISDESSTDLSPKVNNKDFDIYDNHTKKYNEDIKHLEEKIASYKTQSLEIRQESENKQLSPGPRLNRLPSLPVISKLPFKSEPIEEEVIEIPEIDESQIKDIDSSLVEAIKDVDINISAAKDNINDLDKMCKAITKNIGETAENEHENKKSENEQEIKLEISEVKED